MKRTNGRIAIRPDPPPPPMRLVPIRGPSGRLYGMLDPTTLVMEFKQGKQVERIDLSLYRQEPRTQS